MVTVLLFACAPEVGAGGGNTTSLDVDIAPREVYARFTASEFDCTSSDTELQAQLETIGAIGVTNFEDRAVIVTTTRHQPGLEHSWVSATFADDTVTLESGEDAGFDVTAQGWCRDGEAVEAGEHVFDLDLTVADVPYDVTASVTVE